MEFIIDTVNLEDIKEAVEYMPIVGVTSNPSIVKKTSPKDFFKHMKEVRKIIGKESIISESTLLPFLIAGFHFCLISVATLINSILVFG